MLYSCLSLEMEGSGTVVESSDIINGASHSHASVESKLMECHDFDVSAPCLSCPYQSAAAAEFIHCPEHLDFRFFRVLQGLRASSLLVHVSGGYQCPENRPSPATRVKCVQ